MNERTFRHNGLVEVLCIGLIMNANRHTRLATQASLKSLAAHTNIPREGGWKVACQGSRFNGTFEEGALQGRVELPLFFAENLLQLNREREERIMFSHD